MNEMLLPLKDMTLPFQLAFGAIVFMTGASLGSFLAAAVYRITTSKKSIAFDRSECTSCGRKLTALDLVPIFSFLFLRARCRSCKMPISWRYLIIELTSAICVTLIVFQDGFSLNSLESVVAVLVLFAILLIDFDTWLIPVALPIFLTVWGLAFGFVNGDTFEFTQRVIGSIVGFAFLAIFLLGSTWVLRKVGRLEKNESAMGWGDPLLMGAIGGLLGYKLLPFVLWIGCIQAIVVYVVLKIKQRDFAVLAEDAHAEQEFTPPARSLPLGTFLALATMEIIVSLGFITY